jgi:LPXTG-motif cell wall-anchored protein
VSLAATDPNPTDTLTYAVTAPPANGDLTGTPPSLTYTPASTYSGQDSFTYTASDGTDTCSGTITLQVGLAPQGIVITDTTLDPDGRFQVVAGGFQPGTTAEVFLLSDPVLLGTAIADQVGRVSFTGTIPTATPPGPHTVRILGTAAGGGVLELSIGITVGAVVGKNVTAAGDLAGAANFASTAAAAGAAANAAATSSTPTTSTTGTLPATGSGTVTLGAVGLALVAAGGGLLLLARQRPAPLPVRVRERPHRRRG